MRLADQPERLCLLLCPLVYSCMRAYSASTRNACKVHEYSVPGLHPLHRYCWPLMELPQQQQSKSRLSACGRAEAVCCRIEGSRNQTVGLAEDVVHSALLCGKWARLYWSTTRLRTQQDSSDDAHARGIVLYLGMDLLTSHGDSQASYL